MARKELPIYQQVAVEERDSPLLLPFNSVEQRVYDNPSNGLGLAMSPYSDFIPLSYLFVGLAQFQEQNEYGVKRNFQSYNMKGDFRTWSTKFMNTLIGHFGLSSIITQGGNIKDSVKDFSLRIEEWLRRDAFCHINSSFSAGYGGMKDTFIRKIRDKKTAKFSSRGYEAFSTPYSLYGRFWPINNYMMRYEAIDYNPHVLAVVLPENYLYMKYKMVVHGVIDMSKVIILIDRELDTPKFEKQAFRKIYREALAPEILKSGCDVWKVPLEYIKESCFTSEFSFRGLGPREKGKIVEQLIEGFKKYYSNIEIPPTMNWERSSTSNGLGSFSIGGVGPISPSEYTTSTLTVSNLQEAVSEYLADRSATSLVDVMRPYQVMYNTAMAQLDSLVERDRLGTVATTETMDQQLEEELQF